MALIVSGGHTSLFEVKGFGSYSLVGETLDDAAGEVLDKVARLIGLGYPGGAEMDKRAYSVPTGKYSFPKIKQKKNGLNFSFSGLKTSAVHLINKIETQKNKELIPYLCADFQEAVVEQIMDRLDKSLKYLNTSSVVIAGGVSANSRLREKSTQWAGEKKN